jgi:hypothetical protein
MTLIFVKDEKRTIKSLCAMIDKAPKMDVFKLEDGAEGDIIVLSKALRRHPCLEEFHMTSVTLADSSLSLDEVVSMILISVPDLRHIKLEKVPVSSSALAESESCTSLKTPMRGHPCLKEFHISSLPLADPSLSLNQTISMILESIPESEYVEVEKVPASSSALTAGSSTNMAIPIVPESNLADMDTVKLTDTAVQSPSIDLIDDPGCDPFAKALDKNSSIQNDRIEGSGKISGKQRSQIEKTLRDRAGGNAHAA